MNNLLTRRSTKWLAEKTLFQLCYPFKDLVKNSFCVIFQPDSLCHTHNNACIAKFRCMTSRVFSQKIKNKNHILTFIKGTCCYFPKIVMRLLFLFSSFKFGKTKMPTSLNILFVDRNVPKVMNKLISLYSMFENIPFWHIFCCAHANKKTFHFPFRIKKIKK